MGVEVDTFPPLSMLNIEKRRNLVQLELAMVRSCTM
jgi:hypothetical protein